MYNRITCNWTHHCHIICSTQVHSIAQNPVPSLITMPSPTGLWFLPQAWLLLCSASYQHLRALKMQSPHSIPDRVRYSISLGEDLQAHCSSLNAIPSFHEMDILIFLAFVLFLPRARYEFMGHSQGHWSSKQHLHYTLSASPKPARIFLILEYSFPEAPTLPLKYTHNYPI